MRPHFPTGGLSPGGFDYRAAFSRNIGWITEWEQQELRNKTIAIAGMGGVGGIHALTLTRLGIGGFHFADPDRFDVANLNRQAGALMSTVGLEKAAVMAQMTRDINPELRLRVFDHGVDDENLDEFLSGVDLLVDGLDFFALNIRRKVFKRCAQLGIPAVTAAPIGFGSSYLIFMPNGMSFEDYFRLEGLSEEQQYVNFAVGLTPKGFHRSYLVDPSRVDLAHHRGPSSAAAVQLCAGVIAAETVKILLGRGKVYAAPYYHQFDAYRGRWKRGRLRFGNAGPLQSLKRHIGYKAFAHLSQNAWPDEPPASGPEIERILDIARWAPSGDNAQPWQFEIVGDDDVLVHVTRRDDDIYDYNEGQPTLLATGMLLETMRIAASRFGRLAEWKYLETSGYKHLVAVRLPKNSSVIEDPLYHYITIRSVERRAYRRTRLSTAQKNELEHALGDELEIHWHETLRQRWRSARLNAYATDIRLRLRAAYEVHRRIIDWDRRYSPEGVPAAAIGLDPLTLRFMRWVMASWDRVNLMNRLPAGTAVPQIELDLLPGIMCAGHFVIKRRTAPRAGDELVSLLRAGQSIQRFWLKLTAKGLSMQPAIAPIVFGFYGMRGGRFTDVLAISRKSGALAGKLARLEAFDPERTVFRGRLGWAVRAHSDARSMRKPLQSRP
jgi:molybdopterin/thiamine biosynthesis adenylyltransferase